MSERFYYPSLPSSGLVMLSPEEAHHASTVMRIGVGETITLFDGANHEAEAIVRQSKKKVFEVEIQSFTELSRESFRKLTIGVTLPKGDRQKWLIEKCVELGVDTLIPVSTERSVAQPESQVIERLTRQVIEASKQCRRNQLMKITAAMTWESFLAMTIESASVAHDTTESGSKESGSAESCTTKSCSAVDNTYSRWIAHPGGQSLSGLTSGVGNVLAAVGPEGGFTDREVALALEAGFQPLSLGKRILRIETAVEAIAANVTD